MKKDNKIKFQDIKLAFEYVSSSQPLMNSAYISKTTGQIYYHSEMYDSDEFPEDFFEKHDYIEIPHKNDLDLGQSLVWQFVTEEIPGLTDKIRGFFSIRGAYSRYKSFLEEIGLLKRWYYFENERQTKAIREWCEENDINLDG
jgi:hypothetical protein